MKKVENVNIGGSPFYIDEDAYSKLTNYLNSIQRHFSKSEGHDEIIEDIEFRLAELFTEQIKPRKIITSKDLDAIIEIMGRPEDFGAESYDDYAHESHENASDEYERNYRPGRRLFRDGEDKVIAGVCSGLAAYFGFRDPIYMRILFVILFMSGLAFFAYILLWIIVPKAKTASDRLAMTGQTINIESIAKQVEDELITLKDKVSDLGKNFGKKK